MLKKPCAAILAVVAAFLLVGCSKSVDLTPYVSQIRSDILVGNCENYSIRCYLETREKPFNDDGKKESSSFAVIVKLCPRSGEQGIKDGVKVSFSTDKTYSALFSFHPEGDNYVALVYVDKLPGKTLTVTVEDETEKEEITLRSVVASPVASPEAALGFAQSKVGEMLEEDAYKSGKFEINIRLIEDDGRFFYFVGFITEGSTEALLINGEATKLIARKTLSKRQ